MEVVLLEKVQGLGERGDVVKVAVGYARNYLIPLKKAIVASEKSRGVLDEQERIFKKKREKELKEAGVLAAELESVSCTIPMQSGEDDRLFGSVTAQDISESLEKQGYKVDKRKIVLDEPLKALGVYSVPIKICPEVEALVKVWVVKE